MTKNNLTLISKPHAHPHTMKKTPAKIQNDQYKTVRGVALTRHKVNVDGLGLMDGNLHAYVTHAKAGVTKTATNLFQDKLIMCSVIVIFSFKRKDG